MQRGLVRLEGQAVVAPLVDDGTALRNVTPSEADVPRRATDHNFLRLAHFVDCVLGQAAPLVRPEEALDVQRVVDALYESAATGSASNIPQPDQ